MCVFSMNHQNRVTCMYIVDNFMLVSTYLLSFCLHLEVYMHIYIYIYIYMRMILIIGWDKCNEIIA